MKNLSLRYSIVTILIFLSVNITFGQVERFIPITGDSTELWRITNAPELRNWSNYHNTNAWSYDGRYLCYEKYQPYDINPEGKICIYDLHREQEIEIDRGTRPRWAKNHAWLFYLKKENPESESIQEPTSLRIGGGGHMETPDKNKSLLIWYDVASKSYTKITSGIDNLGETDMNDRWIYAYRSRSEGSTGLRIPIAKDSRVEVLKGNNGIQWIPNPCFPLLFYRGGGSGNLPFSATRTFIDLDGSNKRIGSPHIQRCHQSWSGNGEYLLHGNSQMRGRLWKEPFPSNLHLLAAVRSADISPCGNSGRWICGSSNFGPLQIGDLRSGDGQVYLHNAFSSIHDSHFYRYSAGSALVDNDSKGSPDGTKIVFCSNYDLKNGPVTEVTERVSPSSDVIRVSSTKGFPESGMLSVRNEVIGYSHKSEVTFEGLTRNMFYTSIKSFANWSLNITAWQEYEKGMTDHDFKIKYGEEALTTIKKIKAAIPSGISEGTVITSFNNRLIPDELINKKKLPTIFRNPHFPDDKESALLWQKQTDVYVAVVRLPDQPHFNSIYENFIELIPGENHWETYGYHIYKDGEQITQEPLRPGTTMDLSEAGKYTAVAVEFSGLESKQSLPLEIQSKSSLYIREERPADFSWTHDRWLVDGKEVDEEKAQASSESKREIVHRLDGVIHREWYNWGQITKRYDLNKDGKPIRRLYYLNGRLARREYHNRDGVQQSTEYFDKEGYITETILYKYQNGEQVEETHWWFEKGMPVELRGRGGYAVGPAGHYEKAGNKWIRKE